MRSLPSLPLERMSAVFSCGVARCLKNMESCILRCRDGLGGWFQSYRDTAMMLKPKERERSEALTTTKHKQPGAGKQFTSRSLRGARRTTHSELFGSTWALPRSNGSPAACRSDVIFLSDIFLNKVANDHTREPSEGFKTKAAPLAWVCPSGLPPRRRRPPPGFGEEAAAAVSAAQGPAGEGPTEAEVLPSCSAPAAEPGGHLQGGCPAGGQAG